MSEITHWINGKTFDDSAKRHGEIFNPATGEVSKKVAFGTAATVDVAVKPQPTHSLNGATVRSRSASMFYLHFAN